jgi:hypothetical protein
VVIYPVGFGDEVARVAWSCVKASANTIAAVDAFPSAYLEQRRVAVATFRAGNQARLVVQAVSGRHALDHGRSRMRSIMKSTNTRTLIGRRLVGGGAALTDASVGRLRATLSHRSRDGPNAQ